MTNKKVLILLLYFFCSACQEQQLVIPNLKAKELSSTINIGKSIITAGEKIIVQVTVDSDQHIESDLTLHFNNGYQTKIFTPTWNNNQHEFYIPGSATEQAGHTQLYLIYQNRLINKSSFLIRSKKPEGIIESYNGPKTLFAEDENSSMSISRLHSLKILKVKIVQRVRQKLSI